MHGFHQILAEYLQRLRPARIFEWGPGLSTELMIEHAPGARITSVEHDEAWLRRAVGLFGGGAEILHIPCANRNSRYATVAYEHAPIDLAFVDGRAAWSACSWPCNASPRTAWCCCTTPAATTTCARCATTPRWSRSVRTRPCCGRCDIFSALNQL